MPVLRYRGCLRDATLPTRASLRVEYKSIRLPLNESSSIEIYEYTDPRSSVEPYRRIACVSTSPQAEVMPPRIRYCRGDQHTRGAPRTGII